MTDVEQSSGNIYADLGDDQADQMNMKAHLATALGQIIEQRGWTSPQAASLLGLPDAQLSNILTGNFRTEDAASLVHYIARLGYNVQITITKAAQPTGSGCVEVVSAPPR